MGLDWNPLARPKEGFEAEFSRLLNGNLDDTSALDRERLIARFQEISDPPFQTLGAPQIGTDPRADAWLLERMKAHGETADASEALSRMRGFYVLDLLPPSPGLPVYTSSGYDGVDRYTFRGAFLSDVREVLGEDLFHAAWDPMDAAQLSAYGERLLAVARKFAIGHALEFLEEQREPPESMDSPESHAHILFSAGRWCLWWSARGHGLEP